MVLCSSSFVCLGSVPYACCCCGSVPCLRCLCRVMVPCWLTASLDDGYSCMLACLHHPALMPFGYCDIQFRLGCLSPPWLALVLGLWSTLFAQFLGCTVSMVSLTPDSSQLSWMLSAVVLFWLHRPALLSLG